MGLLMGWVGFGLETIGVGATGHQGLWGGFSSYRSMCGRFDRLGVNIGLGNRGIDMKLSLTMGCAGVCLLCGTRNNHTLLGLDVGLGLAA